MVRATLRLGDYVVHVEVAKLKVVLAAVAISALLAIEKPLVSFIVVPDHLTEIGASEDIGAMCPLVEQSQLLAHPGLD